MSKTNSQKPRPMQRTFRLSSVPINIEKEQLKKSLEALSTSTKNGARNVKALSLVPKGRKWQVGTVTFVNEPSDFAECLPNQRVDLPITIAGNEVELAIDCNFLGLTPLYCVPAATVDIIGVCGVGGHAFGSWRSQSSAHKMWLRDFLPNDIPQIRTLIFGYDAALKNSTSTSSIGDYARQLLLAIHSVRADGEGENRRPIIFVAHSMGGLVVKQALAIAAQGSSEDDRAILQSCIGLFLFGVPNRGLNTQNLETLVRGQNNARLIADLTEGSPLLLHIDHAFQNGFTYKDCLIASFFETKDSKTVKVLPNGEWERTDTYLRLVTRDSATCFCPREAIHHQIPIDTDHSSLVKFQGHDDPYYEMVRSKIEELVKEAPGIINKRREICRQLVKELHIQRSTTAYQSHANYFLLEKEQQCHQIFLTTDYVTRRKTVPNRHKGTLEWVLRDVNYVNWMSDETNFLWIPGDPGMGKTDCIEDQTMDQHSKIVTYFFCDDKDNSRNSAESILRGLVHQLIKTTPDLIKHAMRYYQTDGSRLVDSFGTLWDVFLAIVTDPRVSNTYVVLDALDECEERSRNQLLDMFSNYFLPSRDNRSNSISGGSSLKVLMTSRPYDQIYTKLFRILRFESTIRLKTEDHGREIDADIQSFISYKVNELADICNYNRKTKRMVLKRLKTGADGMFLWVSLITSKLLETPPNAVEETLQASPTDINGWYRYFLDRLNSKLKDAEMTKLILKWILFAPKPMRIEELAIACALKPGHRFPSASALNGKSLTKRVSQIISLYGPILKVQEGVIHLVHQSAKEFLLQDYIQVSCPHLFIPPQQANAELAIACIDYLSFDEFSCVSLDNVSWSELSKYPIFHRYQFLEFAAKYWPQFAKSARGSNNELWKSFHKLAQLDSQLSLAFQFVIEMSDCDRVTALYVAAYLGLHSFVARLLRQGYDVNYQGGTYGNVLQVAAYKGHKAIVGLLIDKGADVNAQGGDYDNALQAAASKNHEDIVRMLIKKGAKTRGSGKALQIAASNGNEAIVRLLIKSGADANAQGGRFPGGMMIHRNALQAAAHKGHEVIVRLLIEEGADVNAQGGDYGNALQAAASNAHEATVRLLIESGADVNASTGGFFHGTALEAALSTGCIAIVRLLLDNGANVSNGIQRTNNITIARILSEYEAHTRACASRGTSPNRRLTNINEREELGGARGYFMDDDNFMDGYHVCVGELFSERLNCDDSTDGYGATCGDSFRELYSNSLNGDDDSADGGGNDDEDEGGEGGDDSEDSEDGEEENTEYGQDTEDDEEDAEDGQGAEDAAVGEYREVNNTEDSQDTEYDEEEDIADRQDTENIDDAEDGQGAEDSEVGKYDEEEDTEYGQGVNDAENGKYGEEKDTEYVLDADDVEDGEYGDEENTEHGQGANDAEDGEDADEDIEDGQYTENAEGAEVDQGAKDAEVGEYDKDKDTEDNQGANDAEDSEDAEEEDTEDGQDVDDAEDAEDGEDVEISEYDEEESTEDSQGAYNAEDAEDGEYGEEDPEDAQGAENAEDGEYREEDDTEDGQDVDDVENAEVGEDAEVGEYGEEEETEDGQGADDVEDTEDGEYGEEEDTEDGQDSEDGEYCSENVQDSEESEEYGNQDGEEEDGFYLSDDGY